MSVCYSCGAYPNSPNKALDVLKLIMCDDCGTIACVKHRRGAFGGQCNVCGSHRSSIVAMRKGGSHGMGDGKQQAKGSFSGGGDSSVISGAAEAMAAGTAISSDQLKKMKEQRQEAEKAGKERLAKKAEEERRANLTKEEREKEDKLNAELAAIMGAANLVKGIASAFEKEDLDTNNGSLSFSVAEEDGDIEDDKEKSGKKSSEETSNEESSKTSTDDSLNNGQTGQTNGQTGQTGQAGFSGLQKETDDDLNKDKRYNKAMHAVAEEEGDIESGKKNKSGSAGLGVIAAMAGSAMVELAKKDEQPDNEGLEIPQEEVKDDNEEEIDFDSILNDKSFYEDKAVFDEEDYDSNEDNELDDENDSIDSKNVINNKRNSSRFSINLVDSFNVNLDKSLNLDDIIDLKEESVKNLKEEIAAEFDLEEELIDLDLELNSFITLDKIDKFLNLDKEDLEDNNINIITGVLAQHLNIDVESYIDQFIAMLPEKDYITGVYVSFSEDSRYSIEEQKEINLKLIDAAQETNKVVYLGLNNAKIDFWQDVFNEYDLSEIKFIYTEPLNKQEDFEFIKENNIAVLYRADVDFELYSNNLNGYNNICLGSAFKRIINNESSVENISILAVVLKNMHYYNKKYIEKLLNIQDYG